MIKPISNSKVDTRPAAAPVVSNLAALEERTMESNGQTACLVHSAWYNITHSAQIKPDHIADFFFPFD
jgi:hypothetical protein